jgi:hypothetical protein
VVNWHGLLILILMGLMLFIVIGSEIMKFIHSFDMVTGVLIFLVGLFGIVIVIGLLKELIGRK